MPRRLRYQIVQSLIILMMLWGCDSKERREDQAKQVGPPPISLPEMPGDRFAWLVNWQRGNGGHFAGHSFAIERDGLSALEAIAEIFEAAPVTSSRYRSEPPKAPELIFDDSLLSIEFPKDVSLSFGLNQNGYPNYSVSEMIAHLCFEHGIELIECSAERYRFGLAAPNLPQVHETIERGKMAGLELHVELQSAPKARYRAMITNHGTETVKLGYPGDGSRNNGRPPFVVWSVLPDNDVQASHPGPRCRDRFLPGCGNMNSLSADDIKEIKPGETLDIGSWFGRIWELQSGEAEGDFRARLFYRNDPNHPMAHMDLLAGDGSKKAALEMRKTLDCLLISNEVTFTATKWKEELRKQREEREESRRLESGSK